MFLGKGDFVKTKVVVSIFIGIIICLFLVLSNTYLLVINDETNNTSRYFFIPNKTFALGYTHSVMNTECIEIFEVEDDSFTLKETVYESYGVGLPFLEGNDDEGEYELVDGKFVLSMNRSFDILPMYISHIPNHFIEISGNRVYFNDFLPGDTKVSLYVKKILGN